MCSDSKINLWCKWGWQSTTLHGRAEAISSSVVHKDSEVRHIRWALSTNGYHRGIVERYFGTTKAAHKDSQ